MPEADAILLGFILGLLWMFLCFLAKCLLLGCLLLGVAGAAIEGIVWLHDRTR
jgi:hypothetical protein